MSYLYHCHSHSHSSSSYGNRCYSHHVLCLYHFHYICEHPFPFHLLIPSLCVSSTNPFPLCLYFTHSASHLGFIQDFPFPVLPLIPPCMCFPVILSHYVSSIIPSLLCFTNQSLPFMFTHYAHSLILPFVLYPLVPSLCALFIKRSP